MNERINKILNHPIFKSHLEKIAVHEAGRPFCKHDLSHFLDTARIGYILNLEGAHGVPKDLIYAAALLHDIGRWQEYEMKIEHALASALLCEKILIETDFQTEEIKDIKRAIGNHGTAVLQEPHLLSALLYSADKKSRGCYMCEMEKACDWSKVKKNYTIAY